jgi:hypothetical protein
MAKIKSFDKTTLKGMQATFLEELKKAGKKFGVDVKWGSCKFTPSMFTCKMIVTVEGSEPTEVQDFKRYAPYWGLKPDDFGKKFLNNGTEFTIVGWLAKSYKFPVVGSNARGTEYKFSIEQVKDGMEKLNGLVHS